MTWTVAADVPPWPSSTVTTKVSVSPALLTSGAMNAAAAELALVIATGVPVVCAHA